MKAVIASVRVSIEAAKVLIEQQDVDMKWEFAVRAINDYRTAQKTILRLEKEKKEMEDWLKENS